MEHMLVSAQSHGGSFWAQLALFQDFLHLFPAVTHPLDLTLEGGTRLALLAEAAVERSAARAGVLL